MLVLCRFFLILFSAPIHCLPFLIQCQLNHILREDSFSGHLKSFFSTVLDALLYVLENSYVSLAGALVLLIAAICFVPSKVSRKKRVIIGFIHAFSHVSAALILMLLLELGVEMCIRHKLLATSGMSDSFTSFHFLFLLSRKPQNACNASVTCHAQADQNRSDLLMTVPTK